GEPRASGLKDIDRHSADRPKGWLARKGHRRRTSRSLAAYKSPGVCPTAKVAAGQFGLKPYWGKPAVRNFRGGRGNEVDGLMTICHDARKGRYTGSHWPNHVRASALLDVPLHLQFFSRGSRGSRLNFPLRGMGNLSRGKVGLQRLALFEATHPQYAEADHATVLVHPFHHGVVLRFPLITGGVGEADLKEI